MRLITADQQDFTDHIGRGRGGERGRDIAHIDAVHATVGGQGTLEEECVEAEGHGGRVDTHHPAEAQNHPLQIGGPDVVFGFGFVCAVEI